ncbi:hypothetical protein OROHE_020520 [Orobanche hederae]
MENVHKELEGIVGASQLEAQKSTSDEMERVTSSDGRLPQLEMGSRSIQYEDVEERQLVRDRRRRRTFSSTDATIDVGGAEVSPPSSPPPNTSVLSCFCTCIFIKWCGISSVEHDEAVMLEAATFGGVPEEIGYQLPLAHWMMQNGLHGDVGTNPWSVPRPPSPSFTAQRLIREQQDDEYLAALQEEAEVALAEEGRKEDELRRQLQEEEEIEKPLAAKEAALPKEQTPDDENVITLLVQMPDGTRKMSWSYRLKQISFVYLSYSIFL